MIKNPVKIIIYISVRAVDGDRGVNNKITYSILEGGEGLFDLDADSGFLYVKKPLDRESSLSNNGAFIIKIQVRNNLTSKARFLIMWLL